MKQRQQLERLLTLRQRRQRQAEAALAEQRRQCQAEADRIAELKAEMTTHSEDFDRQQRSWFEAMQDAPIPAQELEQARQTLDDHYLRQAELNEACQNADREYTQQLAESERRAATWARRVRESQAIASLLERKRGAERRSHEGRAELELEDVARGQR